MWFVGLLTILNAVLNNDAIVNQYRFYLGGMPVNVFDVLLPVCFLAGLLNPQISSSFIRTERIHPVLRWSLILFGLAVIGGLVGASYNGATMRQITTAIRNFVAAPLVLFFAYFLTGTFKSSRQYLYWLILAGAAAAVVIMLTFTGKAEMRRVGQDVTTIRAVAYVSCYAGLAACLLFYSSATALRLLPGLIALPILGLCLVGQSATLSRSDWLAVTAGGVAALMLLPRETRTRNMIRVAIAMPLIAASLYGGLYAASRVTSVDMFTKMETRVKSMIPGFNPGENNKAWDTRIPGAMRELRKFATTPLIGGGFAIDDTPEMEPSFYAGLRHNTWTATLAETGLLGFGAFALMTFGTGVVGYRMVKEQQDQTTVLIGALGVITCVYYFVWGNATMTFNQLRWGIPLFVMAGVVLRTRAMQLEYQRQAVLHPHLSSYASETDWEREVEMLAAQTAHSDSRSPWKYSNQA